MSARIVLDHDEICEAVARFVVATGVFPDAKALSISFLMVGGQVRCSVSRRETHADDGLNVHIGATPDLTRKSLARKS